MGFSGTADLMTLFSVRTNPNGQTDYRPTVDIASNQDSTESESIDTPPFAVTHQSNLIELISEQRNDHTLTNCMHQAKVAKSNNFFKGGAKFHPEKIADQWVEQLMLPPISAQPVVRSTSCLVVG